MWTMLAHAVLVCLLSFVFFASPALAGIKITGKPVTVFNHTTQGCDQYHFIDVAASAFRDDAGNVQVIACNHYNRRLIGKDFDSLKPDCNIILFGALDSDPSTFNDYLWITSPYTLDGRTVYALVHNEYHAWMYENMCSKNNSGYGTQECWVATIVQSVSTDSGANYKLNSISNRVAMSIPYPYVKDFGRYGMSQNTNIIKSPINEYYYLLALQNVVGEKTGVCVFRTTDVTNPKSWRSWDGSAFKISSVDPYDNIANRSAHICTPVAKGAFRFGLVYSTYLKEYVALGADSFTFPNGTKIKEAFVYATSKNMLDWSEPQFIRSVNGISTWDKEYGVAGTWYPSIIDHASPERNFDTCGKTAFLYYTYYEPKVHGDPTAGQKRNLQRVPIEFD